MREILAPFIAAATAAAGGGTLGFVCMTVWEAVRGRDLALLANMLPLVLGAPFLSIYVGFLPALIVILLVGLPIAGWLESHYRTGPSEYAQAGLWVGMVPGWLIVFSAESPGLLMISVACITGGPIGAVTLGLILADPPWQTDKWPLPKDWRAWLKS